jgi:thymidylate kinase
MQVIMIIAIIGTHGTGKSTLSYLLATHYKQQGKNVKVIQETARNCPFPLNDKMTIDTCLWIYHEHSKKELEAKSRHDVVICDRSFYDSFVYMNAKYEESGMNNKFQISPYLLAYARTELRDKYDKVIFCKPDMPLISDGVRSADKKFQHRIDSRFHLETLGLIDNIVEITSSQIFSKDEEWKRICL